jgi:hypothetical protein
MLKGKKKGKPSHNLVGREEIGKFYGWSIKTVARKQAAKLLPQPEPGTTMILRRVWNAFLRKREADGLAGTRPMPLLNVRPPAQRKKTAKKKAVRAGTKKPSKLPARMPCRTCDSTIRWQPRNDDE